MSRVLDILAAVILGSVLVVLNIGIILGLTMVVEEEGWPVFVLASGAAVSVFVLAVAWASVRIGRMR